jgi:general secretion pathway protein C
MSARLVAFVIWAAVAASAVFWLMRLAATSPVAPAHTVAVAASTAPRGDLTRVLGAPPASAGPSAPLAAEPALASRFKLLGVAAPRQGGDRSGIALIVVDGKPARGFKVGSTVDGDIVLQSVHPRGAALGPRGNNAQVNLELPALPTAAASPRPPGVAAPAVPVTPPPGAFSPPGGGPIATLPTPVQAVPPARPPEATSETAEPVPVPPPAPAR